ncbi:MAG: TRAP transporter large permease subunit [Alphaproteobacteria bacterium]|nr:TRAP transporter large permease subunit [Alphaproteobacteria bacterium]
MEGEGGIVALLMMALVLAGLAVRLPAPLVLAGGALLGALAGQITGVYNVILLGDLASSVEAILDNEILVAIPLLVLSGTLLGDTRAFFAFRQRLKGPFAVGADLLLAMAGGENRRDKNQNGFRAAFLDLIERAAPASAFLILLADLIDTAVLATDGPSSDSGFDPSLLLMQMALPSLLIALFFGLARLLGKKDQQPAPEASVESTPSWLGLLAALCALLIPGLIVLRIASPVEAGALGVGMALLLKKLGRDAWRNQLGQALDHALIRAAIPFATLLAGAAFHLVFLGIGGGAWLDGFYLLSGPSLLFACVLLLAFLGILIEPLALAVLLVPLLGPLLLEGGVSPSLLGAVFVLAPLSGLLACQTVPKAASLALAQSAALLLVVLVPLSLPFDPASSAMEIAPEPVGEEGGFSPEDTTDSPYEGKNENEVYAPSRDGE